MFEGILNDVTQRRAMEEKLRSTLAQLERSTRDLTVLNSQKDKLLSLLSHDLRSPLSAILGFCEILLQDEASITPEERREFLGFIQSGARDQLGMVEEILDWVRLGRSASNPTFATVDVAAIVQRCVDSLAPTAELRSINLTTVAESGLSVPGDEMLLGRVITNLVNNALKFTPAGGSVEIRAGRDAEGTFAIAVSDTGVGIPEGDLPKLFRLDAQYTRMGLGGEKGTGLGLSICRDIVEHHGGTITVTSTEGKGTTFTVRLPGEAGSESYELIEVERGGWKFE